MCVNQAWLLAGALVVPERGDLEGFHYAEVLRILAPLKVPQDWRYGLDEVRLDELASGEYVDRMADGIVARRCLPPFLVVLEPVVRNIAEYI